DGWTIDDVAVEMRRQTYRYGWLPGYMYAMARNKPTLGSSPAEMLYDQNRTPDPSSGGDGSYVPRTAEFDRTSGRPYDSLSSAPLISSSPELQIPLETE